MREQVREVLGGVLQASEMGYHSWNLLRSERLLLGLASVESDMELLRMHESSCLWNAWISVRDY